MGTLAEFPSFLSLAHHTIPCNTWKTGIPGLCAFLLVCLFCQHTTDKPVWEKKTLWRMMHDYWDRPAQFTSLAWTAVTKYHNTGTAKQHSHGLQKIIKNVSYKRICITYIWTIISLVCASTLLLVHKDVEIPKNFGIIFKYLLYCTWAAHLRQGRWCQRISSPSPAVNLSTPKPSFRRTFLFKKSLISNVSLFRVFSSYDLSYRPTLIFCTSF